MDGIPLLAVKTHICNNIYGAESFFCPFCLFIIENFGEKLSVLIGGAVFGRTEKCVGHIFKRR